MTPIFWKESDDHRWHEHQIPVTTPTASECTHESSIRMEFAGMSREVCEACGRVSVGFVEDHFVNGTDQIVEDTPDSERPDG
jgi:hypothetical protein